MCPVKIEINFFMDCFNDWKNERSYFFNRLVKRYSFFNMFGLQKTLPSSVPFTALSKSFRKCIDSVERCISMIECLDDRLFKIAATKIKLIGKDSNIIEVFQSAV